MSFEEFLLKSRSVHGDKYEYDRKSYRKLTDRVEIICPEHGSFSRLAFQHINGADCNVCRGNSSKKELEWLESFKTINLLFQYRIHHDNGYYDVDGYDPETNTVYEFLGDYWHSNIACHYIYPDKIHPTIGITHSENYLKTINRINTLEKIGYSVIYTWENDWSIYSE